MFCTAARCVDNLNIILAFIGFLDNLIDIKSMPYAISTSKNKSMLNVNSTNEINLQNNGEKRTTHRLTSSCLCSGSCVRRRDGTGSNENCNENCNNNANSVNCDENCDGNQHSDALTDDCIRHQNDGQSDHSSSQNHIRDQNYYVYFNPTVTPTPATKTLPVLPKTPLKHYSWVYPGPTRVYPGYHSE